MKFRPQVLAAVLVIVAALAGAGCSTLPTSGEVHTRPDRSEDTPDQAPYFAPPGPAAGADRESVVRGFLLATQANPPSTSVARSFLSSRARNTWRPTGTLVYDQADLETRTTGVFAHLTNVHEIDERGRWRGGTTDEVADLAFDLVLEDTEWRIDNPPDTLPVPASYFRNVYTPFQLYAFDRTGTVLVPYRVYLPAGEQMASNLVRGLLAGPPPEIAPATTTAFGRGIELDLSVVVGEDGVAEVPLSAQFQRLSPADRYRAVLQLAATLRQLPNLLRLRVTVDGVAVPLADGQTDVDLDLDQELDPVVAAGQEVVAISDGRVVHLDADRPKAVGGPFGADGFALRSVAESVLGQRIAAAAQNGRQAYEAPSTGAAQPGRVRAVVSGTNLLPPVYDRFGGLWVVDATVNGAVVHLVTGGRDRIVQVRGISGRRVAAVTVTRDGTSLVAGLATGPNPSIAVSTLVRSETGALESALPARRVVVPGADLASVVDLEQDSATTVALLVQASASSGRVLSVELDGSPGRASSRFSDPVPGTVLGLVASADDRLPLRVVTADGRLLTLTSSGAWTRTVVGVSAAAYPQ